MAPANTSRDDVPASNVSRAGEVFAECGDFIRAVIESHARDKAQADDLFQDFFLSLVARSVPQGVQNIKSYLYRRIVNYVIDAVRRTKSYQNRIHRYAKRLKYAGTNRPENPLVEAEEMNKMFELIERRLTRTEAQAVALRYKNDYSIAEVAEEMGVNKRSVSRYISAGVRRIRRLLTVNEGICDDNSEH